MRKCEFCGVTVVAMRADARYCSPAHRVAAHRAKKAAGGIPNEMLTRDRWVRWVPVDRKGKTTKKPLTATGYAASSTDESTWAPYAVAKASTVGVGLGFVLGEGIGCIDLDHCISNGVLDDEAEIFISAYPGSFIEVSPSGDGLHIWGLSAEQPGTKRTFNGLSIERYSVGRYITVTGNVYQAGELLPL